MLGFTAGTDKVSKYSSSATSSSSSSSFCISLQLMSIVVKKKHLVKKFSSSSIRKLTNIYLVYSEYDEVQRVDAKGQFAYQNNFEFHQLLLVLK